MIPSIKLVYMKLKIYTDLSLLQIGYPVELLIPFIGVSNAEDKPGKMMSSRFNEFAVNGREFLELTSDIEDADICLLPIFYKLTGDVAAFEEAIKPFKENVEKSGKKTLVFAGHDVTNPKVNIRNSIIFNSALNKSTQPSNMYAWPHFFEDFIKQYHNDKLILREKSATPTVGFCGYAPPFGLKMSKAKLVGMLKLIANYLGIMKRLPNKASHSYRARAIIGLLKSKKVKLNLKLKSNFAFGPAGQLNTGNTKESDEMFRRSFINNILDSDYTLCVRGIGNNSVRFFETICCGRIPVFVNTDSVLPFDHIIDWKKLCIWVEGKDIDNVGEIVQKFHNNISDTEFIELQKNLRLLWEEYFSPIGFFKHLKLFLEQKNNVVNS